MGLFAPPVRDYDGETLRSLADALAKLRELDEFTHDDVVEIKTTGLVLPDGRSTGFVVVLGPCRSAGSRWVIRMPSSGRFAARTKLGERQSYDIAVLNDATSDAEGNVQLANGLFLHQIELRPVRFQRELTQTEEAIVEGALKLLEVEDLCYFPIHEELLPDVQLLHYEAVAQVRISRLKPLQHAICKQMPGVSPSFVATTLKLAGMHFPRSPA